jgi:hypothetical protein
MADEKLSMGGSIPAADLNLWTHNSAHLKERDTVMSTEAF